MLIEAAIGASVGWLWGKLADAARDKDNENAIKKALEESIDLSFRKFQTKHGNSSASFFNQEFLNGYACPEILKYLTRHQQPDLDAVSKALPVNVIFVSDTGFKDEVKEFFDTVFDCMKSHKVLQEIISHRQIEETYQRTKDIQDEQEAKSKILDDGFKNIAFQQQETNRETTQILSQGSAHKQQLDKVLNLLSANLPLSKGNELNAFLTKQLDRTRDLIDNGQVDDAKSLLDSMKDEISESDDYTRFRWHTNLGACYLSHDNKHDAAEQYFTAYNFAENEEKAIANRVRALLLVDNFEEALKESDKAIHVFPQSGIAWALHINTKVLLNIEFDYSLLTVELQQDPSVLLTLSDLKLQEKAYEDSYTLAKDAFKQNEKSIFAKRAMLASALSWATEDDVKSYYKQLTAQQQNALKTAFAAFDDIIPFLQFIQSKHVFTEIAHNLACAAELLGEDQLKKEITTYAFSAYPDEEAFIWHRVKDLNESGDIDAIRKLTDSKINTLEKSVLFMAAEAGANTGDVEWVQSICQELRLRELGQNNLNELFGFKLCAIWKSGDKSSAIKLAKDNISKVTSYPSLLAFYIRILDEYGEINERDRWLQSCKALSDQTSSTDIIRKADLLYDFNYYYDASALYQRLIESPSDDYLTKRYLDSLIKSDQRAKALVELDRLPKEVRNTSFFKRIEANLARASGDLDTLERILKEELDANPSDSFAAIGYVATLYRKNQIEMLSKYLGSNPTFNPIVEQNEIEIAKYQMELGLENQALMRMYCLFRSNPNSSEIAGYFLLLMLLAKKLDQLKGVNEISASTVIYLESNGESKNIIIEPANFENGYGWPECINESSELANELIGKKVGDVVRLDSGLAFKQWGIVGIDSMFIFASNVAHKVVANSASSAGPLWSVNVGKVDGKFDFSPIIESLKQRSQHVEHVFSVYGEKAIPLQILSDALGTDIVTLLLEWPYKEYDLFIARGTNEEREAIKGLITRSDKPYVVDLSCLVELHVLGFLHKSLYVFGKPLVAPSVREQLLGIILIHNKMEPSSIASEIDGQLNFREIPRAYLEERSRFLNELLSFIDDHCEVVPVVGPEIVTEQQADLEQYIGFASNDTILLTRERNAILVSEDGGFRALASGMGVTSSSWLQPILMILRDKKVISEFQYSKSILSKLERRHNFTSVASNDLLWAAKSCPNKVSRDIESAIETFKSQALELTSGVVVSSQFLRGAAECVSPNVLYDYFNVLFKSLSYGRDQYANDIHEALRVNIVNAFPNIKHKRVKQISRKFGHLLDSPPPRRPQIKINVLAHAIRLALKQ